MSAKAVWRCLDMACNDKAVGGRRTFTGPSQQEVQKEDEPLSCPACGGKRIIFQRDIDYSAQVA